VFEPNDAMLRAGLRRLLDGLLGDLFALGAFAGATPAESWFVRVADATTIARESDRGEVVVEIGVAPAEPIEFLVVRVALDAEGSTEPRLLGAGTAMAAVPRG
jgi:phage tail sheath protein FI